MVLPEPQLGSLEFSTNWTNDAAMRVAVLTNPFSPDRTASSTFDLIQTAKMRGHEVWLFHPPGMALHPNGLVYASIRPVMSSSSTFRGYIDCGSAVVRDLSECDVLLMRLQPPFDLNYFSTCRMLECLESKVIGINRPSAILSYPEKLFMLRFPDLHPPTIVSNNREALRDFRDRHGDVIVKPLYDFQGSGIFHISLEDDNFDSVLETLNRLYCTPIVIQKYIPNVRSGDKRIFILDGNPIGAVNRVPGPKNARSNLHAGGQPTATTLSTRDRELCSRIGPMLAALGLVFVGVDVIGEFITEISTTSPTGIVPIRELTGIDVSQLLWEWAETKLATI